MSESQAAIIAPLCIAVPLAAAAIIAPLGKVLPKQVPPAVTMIVSLLVFFGSGSMALAVLHGRPLIEWIGAWTPHAGMAVGISLSVDAMGGGLAAFVALLVFVASLYTFDGFDNVGTLFQTLLLAFLGAMCGFALTGDLFNMFVWFELMTAAAIALTAHKIEEAESIAGAINLAVTNTLGGFCVLLGIALLYGRTGALNMHQIGVFLAQRPPDALIVIAFALIVCGFFIKGAVAPFHYWLDDAHAVAPTPVCVLFSGIMVQLALYGVARVFWTCFAPSLAPHTAQLQPVFVTLALVTALFGAIMAFLQRHLKRLLAFSTVSHSGMFVAAFALFNAAGVAAAALFVLAHGVIKGALFVCAGNYLNRFKSLDEGVLGGAGRRAKVTSALYLIGGLALAALPPFAISSAKIWYDAAMKEHGFLWIAIFMAVASAIDGAAVLRSGLHVTFGIGKAQGGGQTPQIEVAECVEDHLERTPAGDIAAPVLLLAIAAYIGVSGTFANAVSSAAHAFVNAAGTVKPLEQKPEDLAINLAVCLCAFALAFAGLYRERIAAGVTGVAALLVAPIRAMHTGIYTDYVLYAMGGLSLFSVWLLIAVR